MNFIQLQQTVGDVQDLLTCLFDVIQIVLGAVALLVASLTGDDEAAVEAANFICNRARNCAGLPPI